MKGPLVFVVNFLLVTVTAWGGDFEMVPVPAGKMQSFWLTPVSSRSGERAKAPSFWVEKIQVMKYPVTVDQFREFLFHNPDWDKEKVSSLFADESYLESWASQVSNPKAPVTQVSWFAARAFCDFYGMRLPTVNEWEYMAAASETKKDANKDALFLRRILDWYSEPKGEKLKPAGGIYQNLYGIWDLHGLIWEWVDDFNSSFVTGESREDSSLNRNMFCGSGGMSAADKENYAAFMRFAFRSSLKGRSSTWNLGFRCVK